jgi:hypothetical protein
MKTIREQMKIAEVWGVYDLTAAALETMTKERDAVAAELIKAKASCANNAAYAEELEAEALNLKQLLLPYIKSDLEMEGRL